MRRRALRRVHGARRRRADALVHHARPPRSTAREVTTIEGLRDHPMVDVVRARRRAAVRLLHAGPDRQRGRARRRERRRRRPRRSDTPWRATSAAAARTRRSRRRFARGETDPHRERGRGPVRGGLARRRGGRARAVARRAARDRRPRRRRASTGCERARGEAIYTADLRLNGMLHTAVLRSPHAARARSRASTSRRRSRCRACTPRSGPARSPQLVDDCNYQGAGGRRRLRRHARAGARRARARSTSSGRCASRCSIRTRRCARGSLARREPRVRERGDYEQGLAEADVVVSRRVPHRRSSCTTRWRRTRRSCQWVGDSVEVHISTQYIWGIRDAVAERSRAAARQGARRSATTWAAASARRTAPDDYTFIAAELAKRTGRPVKCALTRREENVAAGNRNATIQRLTVGAQAATAR